MENNRRPGKLESVDVYHWGLWHQLEIEPCLPSSLAVKACYRYSSWTNTEMADKLRTYFKPEQRQRNYRTRVDAQAVQHLLELYTRG